MKKALASCVLACCIFALCSNFATVCGAGEHPKLTSAELDIPRLTQGVGGQLTITDYVQVNGTC